LLGIGCLALHALGLCARRTVRLLTGALGEPLGLALLAEVERARAASALPSRSGASMRAMFGRSSSASSAPRGSAEILAIASSRGPKPKR